MALLFMEGFEQYGTTAELVSTLYQTESAMPARWAGVSGTGGTGIDINTSIINTAQPGGVSKSIRCAGVHTDSGSWATATFPQSSDLFVGFALRMDSSWAGCFAISSQTAITHPNRYSLGMVLQANNEGQLQFFNAVDKSLILSTAVGAFALGIWHYVEVNAVFGSGASGSLTLRLDGHEVATVSGVDTACGLSGGYDRVNFGRGGAGGAGSYHYNYFDDIYICDNTTGQHNNFLGSVNVYTLFPNGPGASTQMTPNGLADNWNCVKDPTPVTSTYVSANAADLLDRYTVQSLTTTPDEVLAVAVGNRSMKTDAGPRRVENVLANGAGAVDGVLSTLRKDSYRICQDLFPNQPNGDPWTVGALSGLEIGIRSK